jgi:hypothetical protein
MAPQDVFLKWFTIYEELENLINNKELKKSVNLFGENLEINPEELLFASYILHYKNLDNICFFHSN